MSVDPFYSLGAFFFYQQDSEADDEVTLSLP